MARFFAGLILGVVASGITWLISNSLGWTAVIGISVAVLVWAGEFILDDLL